MENIAVFLADNSIISSLMACLAFITADAILGWCKAIKEGEFDPRKVPQFIKTNILPYLGGLVILAGFALYIPDFKPIYLLAAGLVMAKFGTEAVKDKLLSLFN